MRMRKTTTMMLMIALGLTSAHNKRVGTKQEKNLSLRANVCSRGMKSVCEFPFARGEKRGEEIASPRTGCHVGASITQSEGEVVAAMI